jgi:hypothetical protein
MRQARTAAEKPPPEAGWGAKEPPIQRKALIHKSAFQPNQPRMPLKRPTNPHARQAKPRDIIILKPVHRRHQKPPPRNGQQTTNPRMKSGQPKITP